MLYRTMGSVLRMAALMAGCAISAGTSAAAADNPEKTPAPSDVSPDTAARAGYRQRMDTIFQAGGYVNFAWEWSGPRPKNNDYSTYFNSLRDAGVYGVCATFMDDGKWLWTQPREYRFPHYVGCSLGAALTGKSAQAAQKNREAFAAASDPAQAKLKFLVRTPCFNDPEYIARSLKKVDRFVRESVSGDPTFYVFGAEVGLGPQGNASPVCFGPHTLNAFRNYLKKIYGNIDALNAEWEMRFAGFDDVVPLTTLEIADRVAKTGRDNFAPWLDHRRFMDTVMPDFYGKCQQVVERYSPGAAGGLLMVRIAPAGTGWDLWLASRKMHFIEHNDINHHADAPELIRSFAGFDGFRIRAHEIEMGNMYDVFNTWQKVLHDYNAAVIFKGKSIVDVNDYPAYKRLPTGEILKPVFDALHDGLPAQLSVFSRDDGAIRILYSRDSEQARWIQDGWRYYLFKDGSSRNHYDDALSVHAREAWCYMLEDLGFQYRYISYDQLKAGELAGCRLLILPETEALSEAETQQIRKFVENGGTVVADCFCATMDEHGVRLKTGGRLDDLFGIRRDSPGESKLFRVEMNMPIGNYTNAMSKRYPHRLSNRSPGRVRGNGAVFNNVMLPADVTLPVIPVVEDGITYSDDVTCLLESNLGTKAFAVRRAGKGTAIFLNLRTLIYLFVDPYPDFRYTSAGDGARAVAKAVTAIAGLTPPARITHARGYDVAPNEIFRFTDAAHLSGAEIYAVLPNYHFGGSPLPGHRKVMSFDRKNLKYDPYPAQIRFAGGESRFAYDLLKGEPAGAGKSSDVEITPMRAVILARLPYKIQKMTLALSGTTQRTGASRTKSHPRVDIVLKATGHAPKAFAPHVIRLETFGKGGEPIGVKFATCDIDGTAKRVELPASIEGWKKHDTPRHDIRIVATDVLTGTSAELIIP